VARSVYNQLWDRPKGERLDRGASEIQKAHAIGANTPRERGYIDALAVFYADRDKKDHAARATAYAASMKALYEQFPSDREAGAFYGLSLLASTPAGDTTFVNPRQAVGVLMPLFRDQPNHPGLAHYIIHACDSPTMAAEGLEAARSYARIAPSSPHAVHMPSHIFSRLGLWQESIQSNLASIEATWKASARQMGDSTHVLHAMDFLNYAYLQVGQDKAARKVVDDALHLIDKFQGAPHSEHADMAEYLEYSRAQFPAMYHL
jgi:hypothetical protein